MSALQKKLQEARELIDNRKVITNLDPNFDMQAMQAEMAKNLIALEKEINDKNRQLFLKIMIELGSVEGVKKAIEKGADLNQFLPGSGELIALDFAVSKDQTEIVKCLLNLDLDKPGFPVTRQKSEVLNDRDSSITMMINPEEGARNRGQTIHKAQTNHPENLLNLMIRAKDLAGVELALKWQPFVIHKKSSAQKAQNNGKPLSTLELAAFLGKFEVVGELVAQMEVRREKVSKLAKNLALEYVRAHPEEFNAQHQGYFSNKKSGTFDTDKNVAGLKKLLFSQRESMACRLSAGSLKKVNAILFANSVQTSSKGAVKTLAPGG